MRDRNDEARAAGKVVWNGVEYEGIHEPLVPHDLFQRAQEVFRLRDRAGEIRNVSALRA